MFYAYEMTTVCFYIYAQEEKIFPLLLQISIARGSPPPFYPLTAVPTPPSPSFLLPPPPPPFPQAASRAIGPRPVQPFSHRDGLGRLRGPERNLPGPELWSATGWDKELGC